MSSNGPSKKQDSLSDEQQAILKQKAAEIEKLHTDITTLSKPLLATGGASNWAKHVTPGTLSVFQDASSWDHLPLKPDNGILKRKYSTDIQEAAGSSWKKLRDVIAADSSDDESLSEEELSPTATRLDPTDRKTYGTQPMEEEVVVVRCKTCQRPIMASSFREHSLTCGKGFKKPRALTMNAEDSAAMESLTKGFFSDDDDDDDENDQTKAQSSPMSKKKKAKVEDSAEIDPLPSKQPQAAADKPEKKKTKKEKSKQKATPKQKAPLDLDKQCGVLHGQNNTPCTRSLTCKSHSMGAKRAVAGRSQPYDVLLAAYQKKSIGRPQSGVATTGKGTPVPANKAIKGTFKKLQNTSSPAPTAGAATEAGASEEHYVNSDEEVESVMETLKWSCPEPLAERSFYFVKRRRQCFRLRDILLDAITPKSTTDGLQEQGPRAHTMQGYTSTPTPPPTARVTQNYDNTTSMIPTAMTSVAFQRLPLQ